MWNPVDREEAMRLLHGGGDGIATWNELRARGHREGETQYTRLVKSPSFFGKSEFLYNYGWRNKENERRLSLTKLDLQDCDLKGADLSNLNLWELDCRRADLREANLSGSDITGDFGDADLSGARVTNSSIAARFQGAKLQGTDFTHSNLDAALGPSFRGAILLHVNIIKNDLRRLDLSGLRLDGVRLTASRLDEANLEGAALAGARLRGVHLRGANLSSVDLTGAEFSPAEITGATLAAASLRELTLPEMDLAELDLRRATIVDVRGSRARLRGAQFAGARLTDSDLNEADLRGADFRGATLDRVSMIGADLREARFQGASLRAVKLPGADLREANLDGATVTECDLSEADLTNASLEGARLASSSLVRARMLNADLSGAALEACRIYGIAAWGLRTNGSKQIDLVITQEDEPSITVDNIEVAQFVYLLVHNERLREVLDTITSKVVLILGRFTPTRKRVLDSLRVALRAHDLLPIIFDFEKPSGRSYTETIKTLAHMSRFIVADITDALEVRAELGHIVPQLPSVPVQPILLEGYSEYPTFGDFKPYPWVLNTVVYASAEDAVARLESDIIGPAEAMLSSSARPSPLRSR